MLTVAQAAAHVRFSEKTIRRLIAAGELTVLRSSPRGRIRIRIEDLDRCLERQAYRPTAESTLDFIQQHISPH